MTAILDVHRHFIRQVRLLGVTLKIFNLQSEYLTFGERLPIWRRRREGGSTVSVPHTSTSWDCLPAGIALRHIRVVARRIGTIVPSLRVVGLAIAIIAVVWIIVPQRICERSAKEKPVTVKSIPVEYTSMEPAAVEAAKSSAVEATKPAASVKTAAPAPAVRPGIGEVWLAERGRAQQRSRNCQSSSVLRPRFMFARLVHRSLHLHRPPITLL